MAVPADDEICPSRDICCADILRKIRNPDKAVGQRRGFRHRLCRAVVKEQDVKACLLCHADQAPAHMTAADNDQQWIGPIDLDQDGQLTAALHPIVRRLRTDIIMMQHIAATFDLGHGILRHLQLRRAAANGTQCRAIGIDDHFPVGPGRTAQGFSDCRHSEIPPGLPGLQLRLQQILCIHA